MAEKSEEPTPRRLRRARAEGDSPISAALGQSVSLLAAVLLVPGALAATAARAAAGLELALTTGPASPALAVRTLVLDVLSLSAPLLAAVVATTIALGWVQTGGVTNFARVSPRLERLDPVQGLANLFRSERLFALARSLLTAACVAALTGSLLRDHAGDLARTTGNELAIGPVVRTLGKQLGLLVALFCVGIALVDLVIVQRAWRQRLRMTKDEIRREFREAEGDPEIRAARRRAHREALTGSILNAVREATVVIVNPTHLACALRYVEELDDAPKLVAQGEGELARRIVEAAHAYGIPCVQDVPIARALSELEVGDEIPETLYEAVAEILRELVSRAS